MLNYVRKIYGGRMRYASDLSTFLGELSTRKNKLTDAFEKQKKSFQKKEEEYNKYVTSIDGLVNSINKIVPPDSDINNISDDAKRNVANKIFVFLNSNKDVLSKKSEADMYQYLIEQAQEFSGETSGESSSPDEGGEGDAAGGDVVADDEDEPEETDEDPAEIEKKTKAFDVLGKACDQYVQAYNDESSFKRVWDPIYRRIEEIRGDAVSYLSDIAKYGKNVNNFFKDFGEASKNISAILKSNENVSKKESDILAVLDNDTGSIDRSVALAERIKKAIADETPLSDESDEIKNFVRWIDNLIPTMSSVRDALRRI